MKYVTYLPDTGEIKTWGECDVPIPLDGHGVVLEGDGSAWTHYVYNGALVSYTSAQAEAKAALPDYPATWSNAAMAWEDQRSIEDARETQLGALGAAYAQAITTPVPFTTQAGVAQTFQGDPQSVGNATASMLGCQAAQATPLGFYWLAADNTQVPFTFADLQGLAAALFAQGHAQFVKLQTLKAQVRAAATVESVTAAAW